MEQVADRFWRPTGVFGWKSLGQRCANQACSAKYPMLNGLLRANDGVQMLGRWYCKGRCFEEAILEKFQRSISTGPRPRTEFRHRMPLGLLMVSRGLIQHEQVKAALDLQAETGERVGRCLQRIAGITEAEVAAMVGLQWSCPVYRGSVHPECFRSIPKQLLGRYGMLPVHYVSASRHLYVGFRDRIDHTVLCAVEQMLACHTAPCILEEQVLESALASIADTEERDLVLDNAPTPQEMARIAGSYAQQLRAVEVRLVNTKEYVWVRVLGPRHMANLLFQRKDPNHTIQ